MSNDFDTFFLLPLCLPVEKVVSGVGLEAYWLSSYLWDFVSLVPSVAFTLIVLAATDVDTLISGENGVATFLLFLLYGISMVSITLSVCVGGWKAILMLVRPLLLLH